MPFLKNLKKYWFMFEKNVKRIVYYYRPKPMF